MPLYTCHWGECRKRRYFKSNKEALEAGWSELFADTYYRPYFEANGFCGDHPVIEGRKWLQPGFSANVNTRVRNVLPSNDYAWWIRYCAFGIDVLYSRSAFGEIVDVDGEDETVTIKFPSGKYHPAEWIDEDGFEATFHESVVKVG